MAGCLSRGARRRPVRPRLERLEGRAVPATVVWDGGPTGNGTDWLDPVNWQGDVLPGPGDDAQVGPTGNSPEIVVGATAVRSASSTRAIRLAGPLTVGAATSSFADLTLAGGTLDAQNNAWVTFN